MAPKHAKLSESAQPASNLGSLTAIFIALFVFRVVNAHFVRTFFQPDEYFQALEPAWEIAFGPQSGAWITWEWKERLRTSAHPMLFAAAYKFVDWICQVAGANYYVRANALGAAPRLLQAFWAASMDFLTWRTAMNIYGPGQAASYAAFFLTISSPWQWFCSVRTFSNSLEATLTAVSLFFFPWTWFLQPDKGDKEPLSLANLATFTFENLDWRYLKYLISVAPKGLYPALTAAAMAFYLRPTNIIIWVALSAGLVGCNRNYRKAAVLIQSAVLVGAVVVATAACVDRCYYGEWVFPPFRFLYLNLVQSLSTFYGRNRIDYYFTEGLPLLLTTTLPFAAIGVWHSLRSETIPSASEYVEKQTRFVFALAIAVTLLAFSAIAHKEMRFVYPLLPMLLILASKPFATFFDPFQLPRSKLRQLVFAFMIATNLYIAGYVSNTHQRGVVDVVHYLRHKQEPWLNSISKAELAALESTNVTVGFLMPCHSTPWRSHFVYPEINAWALTCEPPVNLTPEERELYLDEADVFYANPASWLEANMKELESVSANAKPNTRRSLDSQDEQRRSWPQYLVFFEQLEPTLKTVLSESRYKECRRFFNTDWIDDSRRKGDVVVWCMRR